MTDAIEYFFMCFLTTCISSFMKCLESIIYCSIINYYKSLTLLLNWSFGGRNHSCLLYMTLAGATWWLGVIQQLGLESSADTSTHSLWLVLLLTNSQNFHVVAWPAAFQKIRSQVQGEGTQMPPLMGGVSMWCCGKSMWEGIYCGAISGKVCPIFVHIFCSLPCVGLLS